MEEKVRVEFEGLKERTRRKFEEILSELSRRAANIKP